MHLIKGTQENFNPKLTPEQQTVLDLLCKGLTNKQIGDQLFVTEKTIKFHITSLNKKFKTTNRTQLAIVAIKGSL